MNPNPPNQRLCRVEPCSTTACRTARHQAPRQQGPAAPDPSKQAPAHQPTPAPDSPTAPSAIEEVPGTAQRRAPAAGRPVRPARADSASASPATAPGRPCNRSAKWRLDVVQRTQSPAVAALPQTALPVGGAVKSDRQGCSGMRAAQASAAPATESVPQPPLQGKAPWSPSGTTPLSPPDAAAYWRVRRGRVLP